MRSKFFSLGSVIGQMVQLVVIALCSAVVGTDAMTGITGYALHRRSALSGRVYQLFLMACVCVNAAAGLLIMLQHRIERSGGCPSWVAPR